MIRIKGSSTYFRSVDKQNHLVVDVDLDDRSMLYIYIYIYKINIIAMIYEAGRSDKYFI